MTYDTLGVFIGNLRRLPSLSKEDTLRLLDERGREDQQAERDLLRCNLRLVVYIAKRKFYGPDMAEYVQDGVFGLSSAIANYDKNSGCAFSTYAATCITNSMRVARQSRNGLIKVPAEAYRQRHIIFKLHAENKKLTTKEITEHTGFSEITVKRLLDIPLPPRSLSEPTLLSYEDREPTLESLIADDNTVDPIEDVAKTELSEVLNKAMQDLSNQQKKVLALLYGLDGNKPMERRAAYESLNFTKQRLSQLELSALKRIAEGPYKDALRQLL